MKYFFKLLLSLTAVLTLFACASAPYESGLRTPQKAEGHYEGHFKGVGKLKLFEQSWRPDKASTKAVVIVVHGLKDHSSRYAEFAETLRKSNYAVYAFDNRGHGDSEGQRVWVNSFGDYITDLETFYDLVHKAEPNKPIYIFGHSMGGAIVTLFTLRNKTTRPVKGIILSGPALKVGDDIGSFLIGTTKVISALFPEMAVMQLNDESFSRDPEVVKAIKEDKLVYHGKGPARTAKELLNAIAEIQEHMSEVSVPFITLHGEKDVLTNPEGSKELYQNAKSTDKSIKLYPESFHDLLHEPEKAQVAADILAWLESHTDKKD